MASKKKKYENCKKTKATKNKQNSNSINIPCKVAHTHTIPYCKWNERKEKKYTAETISVRSVKTQNIVVDICLFGRLSDSHRHCATKKPTQRKKKQHTHTHRQTRIVENKTAEKAIQHKSTFGAR